MAEGRGEIAGYDYGAPSVARSPLGLEELELLKQMVLFGEEDEEHLRMAGDVLEDQVEDVLDVWYGFVADHPHLVRYFSDSEGRPDEEYLGRVRGRFGQWILDTCRRPYDQEWLDYQQEIALRHTRDKKNQTDGAYETPDLIGLRYVLAFIYPITATIRPFLANKGHGAEEVDKMHQAWFKSVVLQATLWSQPYAKDGDF
jgi:Protoglobin